MKKFKVKNIFFYFKNKNLISNILELNLLFQTANRIKNGKIELKNLLENHIYQIGIETIERINPIPTHVNFT